MDAYGGEPSPVYSATIPILPSRSQIRNAKRKHTLACLKQGIIIAAERRAVYTALEHSLELGEAFTELESLAIHRVDCAKLQHNVHFASEANYCAHAAGLKSKCSYNQHKLLHRHANLVKHEHEHGSHITSSTLHLPPPPPPQMTPLTPCLLARLSRRLC